VNGRKIVIRALAASTSVAVLALVTALTGVPPAMAATGAHETVEISTTSADPGASAGLTYRASYHSATDPESDPPALRRLVIELPAGTRTDTSVPGQCTASDMEIMLIGQGACPASARIGSGQVTVREFGLSSATYDSVLENAPGQQLELVTSGSRVLGVVHTYIQGTTLDGPIPTCLTGGQPPSGCPIDQLTLLSNHLQTEAISRGQGRNRRNYGTTPSTCPPSRLWTGRARFYYADGSSDSVVYHVACRRPPRPRRRALRARRHWR
jgi:hypothetical protein